MTRRLSSIRDNGSAVKQITILKTVQTDY